MANFNSNYIPEDINRSGGERRFFRLRFITFAELPVLLLNVRARRMSANNTVKRAGMGKCREEKYSPLPK